MKPETLTRCSNEAELNTTRTTRHAIRRNNVGLKCGSCQRRFPSAKRLQRHLKFIHKNSGRLFCCNKCQITFDDLSVFLQHSRGHRLERKEQHEDEECQARVKDQDSSKEISTKQTMAESCQITESKEITSGMVEDSINCVGDSPEMRQDDVCMSVTDSHEERVLKDANESTTVAAIEAAMNEQLRTCEVIEKMGLSFANEHLSDHPTMATIASQMHSPYSQLSRLEGTKLTPYKRTTYLKKDPQTPNSSIVSTMKKASRLPKQSPATRSKNKDVNIKLPHGLKTINLLSDDSDKSEIISYLDTVNHKLDAIIRHFNVPLPEAVEGPSQSSVNKTPNQDTGNEDSTAFWNEDCQVPNLQSQSFLNQTNSRGFKSISKASFNDNIEMKNQKTHTLPSQSTVADPINQVLEVPDDFPESTLKMSDEVMERLRSKSLNRGNFAKNLVFHLFTPEERKGRNCFGRRAGVQSGPKAPLNPLKLQAVREIVFQHYPCIHGYEESIWRRECVIAIDTGLRGENRTNLMKQKAMHSNFLEVLEDQGIIRKLSSDQ